MNTQHKTKSIHNEIADTASFQRLLNSKNTLNLRHGYQLGTFNFLINAVITAEVISKPTVYPMPGMPSWIIGLVNLRGLLVPVFDVKKHLDVDDDFNSAVLLVLDKGEHAISFFIDKLPALFNTGDDGCIAVSVPDNTKPPLVGCTNKVYRFQDRLWFDIDHDAFIKKITEKFF